MKSVDVQRLQKERDRFWQALRDISVASTDRSDQAETMRQRAADTILDQPAPAATRATEAPCDAVRIICQGYRNGTLCRNVIGMSIDGVTIIKHSGREITNPDSIRCEQCGTVLRLSDKGLTPRLAGVNRPHAR